MAMDKKRREQTLDSLQHLLATASQLKDLLTRISDVRSANGWESDTWPDEIMKAREALSRALAAVTRNAVL